MDMSALPDLTPYVTDIILIVVSGSACLYCATLSRRLKRLNNLKTGVGASIVSLTQAIENTHKAAQEAQQSTLQTVETLRHLIEKSERTAPKIEALITELERKGETTKVEHRKLERDLATHLIPAVEKAQKTASGLLKIVSDIDKYRTTFAVKNKNEDCDSATNVSFLKDVSS